MSDIRNQTVLPMAGVEVIPHSSESDSTIRRPRPWGSVALGDCTAGRPPPWSVTETVMTVSDRSTATSNPPDACSKALVASSDTIKLTES